MVVLSIGGAQFRNQTPTQPAPCDDLPLGALT